MSARGTIGHMSEFNPTNETVTAYLERFLLFVAANSIADAQKVPTLLTVVGASNYTLIRGLVSPDLPKDKTFDELVDLLKKHFDPQPIVIAERFHFYKREQRAGESLTAYVAQLRKLASRCEFGTFLNEALRDRFVCGMLHENIQKVLLTKAKLDLDKALEISLGMEAAAQKAKEFKGTDRTQPVMSVQTPGAGPSNRCTRCGRENHTKGECKFRNSKCHKCGKIGHIAPVCRSKASASRQPQYTPRTTKWVDTTTDSKPVAGDDPLPSEPLFVVRDRATAPYVVEVKVNGLSLQMEVDSGASVSLAPEAAVASLLSSTALQPSNTVLKTYTGEQIPVKGTLKVDVEYEQQRCSQLSLLVVHGSGPCLLGRDWLSVLRLDWRNILQATVHPTTTFDERVKHLPQRYPEVFADTLGTITPYLAKLSVNPEAPPKFFKPRPVPFALRDQVGRELDRLERDGVLEKTAYSEWAAPVVIVPKQDGNLRLCGDFKVTINSVMDIDQYPLPKPADIFATLSGGQRFTTLDLSHAYNQLQVDEESRKFLTINTHQGLYRYTRLPFGIASAPAIFQRTMDSILQGLDGVACYIDDILVTGKSDEEHLARLEEVLERLHKHGVHVKRTKCHFLKPSVVFLGHRIDSQGIHPTEEKLKAIVEAPSPRNVQELRSFLGLVNYYGKFIQNAATILAPLNSLLRKDTPWEWTQECQQSFKLAKETLTSSKVLVHYDPSLPIRLIGDASAYGVGAVIAHVLPDGTEHPVAYASRTLTSSERNYAQVEKEALSLIFGVRHFHAYLYGRPFTIVTDHKPLTAILGSKKGIPPLAAARLQRWAWILSAYKYEIEFRPTEEHGNADALSRLPLKETASENVDNDPRVFNVAQLQSLPVNVRQLRAATSSDLVLSKVLRYTRGSWPREVPQLLRPFFDKRHELTVEEGCLLWGIRVIVPKRLRAKLLDELHRDHPGIVRMKSVARSYMWWPGLDQDIQNLVKACKSCQSVKNAPPVAPLHPWVWPSRPWQRVHLDFAGPFQNHMFLIGVDAYSKWPEVRVMSTTTASATLDVLREWFSQHGIPELLVTDNGSQFTSEAFVYFTKQNGIKHVRSAPYHPASNGLAERFVQSLKQSLKATTNDDRSLIQRLSSFLLTYRTTPHATTGVPPCKLLVHRELRTRFNLLQPDVENSVVKGQHQQKSSFDRRSRFRTVRVGDRVLVRDFRSSDKWIPAVVVEELGPVTFIVETDEGQRWKRHLDQIKSWITRTVHTSPPETGVEDADDLAESQTDTPAVETPLDNSDTTDDSSASGDRGNDSTIPEIEGGSLPAETDPVARRYPTRTRLPPDYY